MNAHDSSADLKLIDRLCDEFESAWRNGEQPRLEAFLERLPPAQRPKLLRELLALELDYHSDADREPNRAEYEARFAQWQQVVGDVFRDAAGSTARGRSAAQGTKSFDNEALREAEIQRLPQLPGYDVLEVLGRGATGVVYKARHARLGRIVALKMLLAGEHADRQHMQRFRAEAAALAALQHPNIVQVFEVGEHGVGEQGGLPFFALEFVPGGTLRERTRGAPQRPADAARLTAKLAAAVQAAHDQGVIHRDIKPSNVLLTADGTPKLTDFGLARRLEADAEHTRTGDVVGTPSYMAPEQAGGRIRDIGPHSDVYGLGAVLYELLTGRPPFRGETGWDTVAQVLSQDPVSPRRLQPKVPRDLETICLKSLAKSPRERYATARELADDLARWLEGKPIQARPVGVLGRAIKFSRRKPAAAALVVVIVASIVAAVAGLAIHNDSLSNALADVREQRDRAIKAEGESTKNYERAEATHKKARAAVNECFAIVTEDELFEGAGMEPARKLLLEAAAKYFDELAMLRATTPEERAELADTLYKLGVIRDEIGDQRQAAEALNVAASMFQRLIDEGNGEFGVNLAHVLERKAAIHQELGSAPDDVRAMFVAAVVAAAEHLRLHPEDDEAAFVQAIARANQGKVEEDLERHDKALELFQQALTEFERLEKDDRTIVKYRSRAAMTNLAIGRVYRRLEDVTAAAEAYQAGHDRLQRLLDGLPAAPGIQFHYAMVLMEQAKLAPDHAAALRLFEDTRHYVSRLNAASPKVHEYKAALAACDTHIGDELSLLNRPQAALPYYEESEHLYEELRADNPDNVDLQVEAARTLQETALALTQIGENDRAAEKYQQALAIREKLVRDHQRPEHRQDLTRNLNNLAMLFLERGENDRAQELLSRALAERRKLTEQFPKVPQFRRDVGAACINLDQAYRASQQYDLAIKAIEEAIAVFKALHAEFPENDEYLHLLAASLANAGTLKLHDLMDAEGARACFAEAEPHVVALAARQPRDRDAQQLQLVFWFTTGQLHMDAGEVDAAVERYEKAIDVGQAVIAENPKDAVIRNSVGQAWQNIALARWKQMRTDDAFAAWTTCIAELEEAVQLDDKAVSYKSSLEAALAAQTSHARDGRCWDTALDAGQRRRELAAGDADKLFEVAVDLALCGQAAEKALGEQPPDAAAAGQFANSCLQTLSEAVTAGFADAEKLRSAKAFAPLRNTPEFQGLVKQLNARPGSAM